MLKEQLSRLAFQRMQKTETGARIIEEASEIVVFGSRSVGLERRNSDIDILCVSRNSFKVKTQYLDMQVFEFEYLARSSWLGSELASHIAAYGTWIKGAPEWLHQVQISEASVEAKRRRVSAFLGALPMRWPVLAEGFRRKYATKIRRETQRLLLLEEKIPIPPTILLDQAWKDFSMSALDVEACLRRFLKSGAIPFEKDLLSRVFAEIERQESPDGEICDRLQKNSSLFKI